MSRQRVRTDLEPAQDAGACLFCTDQDADEHGRRPEGALVYTVQPEGAKGPSVVVRICEPCLLDLFRQTATSSRQGIPLERMGMYSWPLRAPGDEGEVCHAVVFMFYPPTQLRDAPRATVEEVIMARKKAILTGIIDEVHRAYTSEPTDPTTARNVAEALTRHADSQRRG